MRYVNWTVLAILAAIVTGFLHYTLPQHDVVRIVGTYQERQDLSDWTRIFWATPDDQATGLINRDVQFIQAVKANGKEVVYRNEDTGWVWPPYFKYDSSNLQAEAANLKSSKEVPKWVSVTHYGWRLPFLSIYPNAVKVHEVAGPDDTRFPWLNTVILVVLAMIALTIRRMWLQFRERMVDPVVSDAGDVLADIDARADAARAEVRGFWGRLMAWFGTWRKKPRP